MPAPCRSFGWGFAHIWPGIITADGWRFSILICARFSIRNNWRLFGRFLLQVRKIFFSFRFSDLIFLKFEFFLSLFWLYFSFYRFPPYFGECCLFPFPDSGTSSSFFRLYSFRQRFFSVFLNLGFFYSPLLELVLSLNSVLIFQTWFYFVFQTWSFLFSLQTQSFFPFLHSWLVLYFFFFFIS